MERTWSSPKHNEEDDPRQGIEIEDKGIYKVN
jgi:hypothetical protein